MGQNCDGTFTEIRRIVARDVDMNNKLKMSATFAIVQETANAQCAEFGCGWNDLMAKYNACYVLTRMRFEIKKHPAAGDDVVIRTWPNKNIKAIFTRYFTIEDTEGNLYGSGVSQWALFNVVKRAVMRPSECNIVLPEVTSREVREHCFLQKIMMKHLKKLIHITKIMKMMFRFWIYMVNIMLVWMMMKVQIIITKKLNR